MALVIDAYKVVENRKRLPKEAFFVDTNILIDYKDPFSMASENNHKAKMNEALKEIIPFLKSTEHTSYSTLSVAIEYYKHIQVNFYQIQTGAKYDPRDFKKRRDEDVDFMNLWDSQVSAFNKLFRRTFPLVNSSEAADILADFKGSEVDFGDHALYKSVMNRSESERCIFSNDIDFYKFPDNIHLVTLNNTTIELAKKDGKMITP